MVLAKNYSDILICPKCLGKLNFIKEETCCDQCITTYKIINSRILDLRIQEAKEVSITMTIGDRIQKKAPKFGILKPHPHPQVQFDPRELPVHLSPSMASYIPKASSSNSLCLDLGCGSGQYRKPMEQAGYRWIGFDFSNPNAPLWADAHALPFPDNTFDFVISLAVLEHIQNPPVMLREVYRVLKPGGTYFGSVAYLVPFHDSASYFNMTHYGVWSALEDAGLKTEFVYGDPVYLGIRALAFTGLFPGLKRQIAYGIVQPIIWLYQLYWALKHRRGNPKFTPEWQMFLNTGAFVYRSIKPIK